MKLGININPFFNQSGERASRNGEKSSLTDNTEQHTPVSHAKTVKNKASSNPSIHK